MTDLYEYLHAKKGYSYKPEKIKPYSMIKRYPDIDTTRELKGNSRVIGDAEKYVQNAIIDMLITISVRYSLNYKEISYILLLTKVESGFNPDAAAGTTSAAGLPQATDAFCLDAKEKSKEILGFALDIEDGKVFDAEKGCYAIIYSFLINKNEVSRYYSEAQNEYWEWIYLLHHDGAYSLRQYLKGEHQISSDGKKWADYIVSRLSIVEDLLKTTKVNTSFKLSTTDGTPVAKKNYVAVVSLSFDSLCPNTVSGMKNPLIFIQGITDSQGKTKAINTIVGAEIVFTILKDNYKKLAMSGNDKPPKELQEKNKRKPISSTGKKNGGTYTVRSGDTLSAIAKKHGTTVNQLIKLNNLPNANVLHIGQVLTLRESTSTDTESSTSIEYISRYISSDVKKSIVKSVGIENGNDKAAISYSRSHIALPSGSVSADVDKNKNVVHIKTTTKPESIKEKQKPPEKNKTDDKGAARPTIISNDFEPVVNFAVSDELKRLVTSKSLDVIKKIMKSANIHKITITSTLRTVQKQVDAMYANMKSKGVQSQLDYYAASGREVIKAAIGAGGNDENKVNEVKLAMIKKILSLQDQGRLVSRHCVSEDMYATRNVFDISKNFSSKKSVQLGFDKALTDYAKNNDGFKYISPFKHKGEPAFHVEIEQ